jgi:hypothetical protein
MQAKAGRGGQRQADAGRDGHVQHLVRSFFVGRLVRSICPENTADATSELFSSFSRALSLAVAFPTSPFAMWTR